MSDQPTPIRTDVPPMMHPGSLGNLEPVLNQQNTLGAEVFNVASDALKVCYEAFGQLQDAEKALKAAKPVQRLIDGRPMQVVVSDEYADAAQKAWDRLAPAIDRKVKQLQGTSTVLATRVDAALDHAPRKTPEGIALAAEVRAFCKSLPVTERTTFISEAINNDDKATIAALLHAQPFLSGLTPDAHANMRLRAAAKFAPLEHAQHQAATQAMERVMNAGSQLMLRYGKAMKMRNDPAVKAAAQVAKLANG
jgi:hypothetical protein